MYRIPNGTAEPPKHRLARPGDLAESLSIMPEPRSRRLIAFVDFLLRRRTLLLGLAAVLFVLGVFGSWDIELDPLRASRKLKFDRSIEALFEDEGVQVGDRPLDALYAREEQVPAEGLVENFRESKRAFGGDEFVIVAWREPQLFEPGTPKLTPASEERIEVFARELSQIPGVRSRSTQHLADVLRFRFGRAAARDLMEGMLVGADDQTTAVALRLEPEGEAEISRGATIRRIREIAARFPHETYVVGEPVQVHDLYRYVEEDGWRLFGWSLALLGVVLIVLFRRVRWVVLPLAVVVVTIVWTEAVLVASRVRLSMVSSMLNSLVTIIGIATVMHVAIRFRELRHLHDRVAALRQTLIELWPAIFWTCATTAAGFAALLSSRITPVRSFALMMSLATLLVLAAATMILPGGILLGRRGTDPRATPGEGRLGRLLGGVSASVRRRPRLVSVAVLAVVAAAGYGFTRLTVETDFSRNFRADSEIVQSLNFVETRLGGAGSWEVNFPAPAELTSEYLDRVRRLADRLRALQDQYALTKVVAITDGLDLVPRIPLFLDTMAERLEVLNAIQPEFGSTLYNPEAGRMRIMLRADERQQADDKLELIAAVERVAREEFPANAFPQQEPPEVTGLFLLLAFLIQNLLADQLVSFLIAAAGVLAMMTIAFRSLSVGLISLVPNVFPIVLVIGGMGLVGLPINIGTAMIASVSMGLTVDSSIHYISGYRLARARGENVDTALRTTNRGVGMALVFANLALIIGFTVLTQSYFIPLVYFGILVSVAMIGGLIGNLVLLPLMLPWTERAIGRGDGQHPA